jgi:hypothetical protein
MAMVELDQPKMKLHKKSEIGMIHLKTYFWNWNIPIFRRMIENLFHSNLWNMFHSNFLVQFTLL